MRVCTRCGIEKPLDDFYLIQPKNRTPYRMRRCKLCCSAVAAEWNAANPERVKEIRARHRKTPKEKEYQRRAHLARKFGITLEELDALLEAQNGRCAICREEPPEGTNLFLDHDHQTGALRGLLCRKCNSGIGFLRDDIALLRAAIRYLSKYS